jgi:hypothetical protein
MGSAVDPTNLTHELQRYHDAGLGGVHIIPIYGAKGYEDRFIEYLSPKWMEMLAYTVREAHRLDMGVDMTMGTGWCFGGPHVTDEEANARVIVKTYALSSDARLSDDFNPATIQALVAFSPDGRSQELTDKIQPDGRLDWLPPEGTWQLYVISQRPSGQKVKRAAPGGQGHMLNLIYPEAMRHYLSWFDTAFAHYTGPKPRALYHDSYEYRSDWAPDFFSAFEKRRGYPLQTELPALFSSEAQNAEHVTPNTNRFSRLMSQASLTDPDHIARVKSDYRETISDVMVEDSLPQWTRWAHAHGFINRNEAHGSPGNWLDLYADADIPETEMFHLDRNKLVSKFASSAAHVTGKNLAAAETGTWLTEHFTETLADMKFLLDDMFLSGINHVIYHGTCYSPDDVPWPGWVFYASYEMNPRNSIWHDVPVLNAYAARCQAVLQAGHPDNDILLYWPIHDLWHNPAGLVQPLTVHARQWFEDQPMGHLAERLWNRGYAFDYISDRQLSNATVQAGSIKVTGGAYRIVVVPQTAHMPVETLRRLLDLAKAGATIVFEKHLPSDVPGLGQLEQRRAELKRLCTGVPDRGGKFGAGSVLIGDVEPALAAVRMRRESMFDRPGLMCVRRSTDDSCYYFIANRSDDKTVNGWVPLALPATVASMLDPLTGRSGVASVHRDGNESKVLLQLSPGASVLLCCRNRSSEKAESRWAYWDTAGAATEVSGIWHCKFMQGGPVLPAAFESKALASWTELGDTNAQRFAGSALYAIDFAAPTNAAASWQLDLGKVCQSARVRLNGIDLGTLISPPFRVVTESLKPAGNLLEVEVTNTSGNRVRDLDRRGVKWKNFYDANFVNLDYKPFDASNWPLAPSGLLGPVTLTPLKSHLAN